MQDEIAIDLQELAKPFVVCRNEECGAEVGLDLTKNIRIKPVSFPACGNVILEVDRQERFDFTWASLFKQLLNAEGRPRIVFWVPRAGR